MLFCASGPETTQPFTASSQAGSAAPVINARSPHRSCVNKIPAMAKEGGDLAAKAFWGLIEDAWEFQSDVEDNSGDGDRGAQLPSGVRAEAVHEARALLVLGPGDGASEKTLSAAELLEKVLGTLVLPRLAYSLAQANMDTLKSFDRHLIFRLRELNSTSVNGALCIDDETEEGVSIGRRAFVVAVGREFFNGVVSNPKRAVAGVCCGELADICERVWEDVYGDEQPWQRELPPPEDSQPLEVPETAIHNDKDPPPHETIASIARDVAASIVGSDALTSSQKKRSLAEMVEGFVDKSETDRVISVQGDILKTLAASNKMCDETTTAAAEKFEAMNKRFKEQVPLVEGMKHDLMDIFKRIRKLKKTVSKVIQSENIQSPAMSPMFAATSVLEAPPDMSLHGQVDEVVGGGMVFENPLLAAGQSSVLSPDDDDDEAY